MSDEVKLLPCEGVIVQLLRQKLDVSDELLDELEESGNLQEVARAMLNESTRPPIVTDEVVERVTPRFYVPPFRLVEPKDEEAATIVDAYGNAVAVMMWPCHLPEETEAAEQETYAVGRAFVAAIAAMPAVVQDGGE